MRGEPVGSEESVYSVAKIRRKSVPTADFELPYLRAADTFPSVDGFPCNQSHPHSDYSSSTSQPTLQSHRVLSLWHQISMRFTSGASPVRSPEQLHEATRSHTCSPAGARRTSVAQYTVMMHHIPGIVGNPHERMNSRQTSGARRAANGMIPHNWVSPYMANPV